MAVLLCVGQAKAGDRAADLKVMIDQNRAKSNAVGAETAGRGAGHAGTAFNEIGAKEYACASLAFLLGKDDIFERLGSIKDMDLIGEPTEGDVHALSIQALRYENWAISAENASQCPSVTGWKRGTWIA